MAGPSIYSNDNKLNPPPPPLDTESDRSSPACGSSLLYQCQLANLTPVAGAAAAAIALPTPSSTPTPTALVLATATTIPGSALKPRTLKVHQCHLYHPLVGVAPAPLAATSKPTDAHHPADAKKNPNAAARRRRRCRRPNLRICTNITYPPTIDIAEFLQPSKTGAATIASLKPNQQPPRPLHFGNPPPPPQPVPSHNMHQLYPPPQAAALPVPRASTRTFSRRSSFPYFVPPTFKLTSYASYMRHPEAAVAAVLMMNQQQGLRRQCM